MKFLVFDREENLISILKDVIDAKHTEEINGQDTLEITTLDLTIKKYFKILYKTKYGYWKEFIVKKIQDIHTNAGIEREIFCESSFYETFGDYIEDKRPQNVTANFALGVALEKTRWEVGIVEDLGINSTNFYHISAKEAVQKVAETWGAEIRTRIIISGNKVTHRYVDLLKKIGYDLGKRFTYTKDIDSVTKTVQDDDVITALYGYGKGEEVGEGYGRRINFAEINNGKAYVENLEAKEIWGRLNGDGTRSHIFGKVEFDDCEDPQELLELTKEKLKEVSHPLVTYEAKVIDLGGADLGDNVAVIDKEFTPELRLKARVVKIVRDLLEEDNDDITLGNFIPNIADTLNEQQKYIDNFRGKQGIWDRSQIINQDGTINAQFLNNLVDELNTRMNASGGYVYISEDGEGLTTYDKPIDQNPTMAIQLLGGAFRIAGSKNSDGSWNWRTFGDGKGFVADSFVGGLLKGGKVHFDLTNGTLLIGDSISDYTLLWDGSHLKIQGGSFTIGGKSGNTTEITNGYGKWLHEDGSYTKISSQGLMRYDSGIGKQYHYMTKIIKFTAGGDNQSPSTKWIPIGAEFNNKQWSAALSISDSMTASSSQAAIHRIVLTQSVDSNGNTIQPRYRNGQWEMPVMGYKINVNAVEDTRRYGPIAGIMIVTA